MTPLLSWKSDGVAKTIVKHEKIRPRFENITATVTSVRMRWCQGVGGALEKFTALERHTAIHGTK